MKTFTKIMSVLLVVVMCVGMMGSGAYASLIDMGGSAENAAPVVTPAPAQTATPTATPAAQSTPGTSGGTGNGLVDMGGSEDGLVSGTVDENGVALQGVAKIVGLNGMAAAYSTIGEAAAAATDGSKATITLYGTHTGANVSIAEKTSATTMTLNLNGNTLNLNATSFAVGENVKLIITGSGKVTNCNATLFTTGSDVEIKGGTFYADPTSYLADGYAAKAGTVSNDDGTTTNIWNVVPAVAQVGTVEAPGTGYATLAEAIAAATDGGTITLIGNVSGEAITIPVAKTLTIDLDGYTLTEASPIVVNSALTIKDTGTYGNGKIVGSSSAALFTINDVTNPAAYLTIESGYMSSYSALYTRESTTSTTPVILKGGVYSKDPGTTDIESGKTVRQSGGLFYIVNQTTPVITGNIENGTSAEFNSDYFLQSNGSGTYVNNGRIVRYLSGTNTYTYVLTHNSSTDLESVSVGSTTVTPTSNAAYFNATNKTFTIPTDSALFKDLVAGAYDLVFDFGTNGTVKVPLYVIPNVTGAAQYALPDANATGVVYTFGNSGEPANISYVTFGTSASSAKVLTSSDYTAAGYTLTIGYNFLNDNYTAGNYNVYFWYNARIGFSKALALTGTTSASPTPTATATVSPSTSPTTTTASIKPSSANSNARWYNGISTTLKFDITGSINSVQVGGATLTSGTNYTIANNVLTLTQTYLNSLPYKHASCVNNAACPNGTGYTITVYSSDGTSAATTFTVQPGIYAVNDIVNHTYKGTKTLSFTASDPISKVYVGTTQLTNDSSHTYYELSNGNKTVTLTAAFLNSQLSIGGYTLTVIVTDGSSTQHTASCGFNIISASDAAYAEKMGDSNNIYIWIAVIAICAIAVVALIPKKKKQTEETAEDQTKGE